MSIPQSFLEELKSRINIEDFVSNYVQLKRRGKNLVGLCPFHNEKTPSFTVYPENGSFYCFGCQAGGDIITFAEMIENLDYIEAVKLLAQRAGLSVPENSTDNGLGKLKMRIYEMNRLTALFYHKKLFEPEGKIALKYFYDRGLSIHIIKHFGLGYSPESRFELCNFLRSKGYSDREIVEANLGYESRNGHVIDRFFNRVMFPIIDLRGNVIAFGGRIMGKGEPKYLNSSDTPVYQKGKNLFALNFAKKVKADSIILCEGYMDVIALHQAGFPNSVAGLGTALTPEQAKLIRNLTSDVIASYDADAAGQKAASRSIPILKQAGLHVKILVVPNGKDPDEFIRSYGEQGHARFKQLLEKCNNDIEYTFDKLRSQYNLQTMDGKLEYLNEAVKLLASMRNFTEQSLYISKLSEEVGVERQRIDSLVESSTKKLKQNWDKKEFKTYHQNRVGFRNRINPDKYKNLAAATAEEGIIAFLMINCDKQQCTEIQSSLSENKFKTSFNYRLYHMITDKIANNGQIHLTDLSADLSQQEMSVLSGIMAKFSDSPPTIEDIKRYINVLSDEQKKQSVRENKSEEDIKAYIEHLKKIKSK